MTDPTDTDPKTGTTDDPNQATRTGLPETPEHPAKVRPDDSDPDDPRTGPGSTSDPNQANRT
ncbi:hypothetical protein LX81_03170 [Palleronia aestuarii]|uniref:Uncharacterized protein n=1 Tax=Palleronia aestuarii TaxID=568105 RepID=A0A2W7N0X4_9RHOB|nr:hypothetical protein [Palleronia aestuarii]PZX13621.1 hypothetical protein LX81_03170 [Palleronia aestuarii]